MSPAANSSQLAPVARAPLAPVARAPLAPRLEVRAARV
jgi:hypothetical protein